MLLEHVQYKYNLVQMKHSIFTVTKISHVARFEIAAIGRVGAVSGCQYDILAVHCCCGTVFCQPRHMGRE